VKNGSAPEQLDLFGGVDLNSSPPVLNGVYYEKETGMFVSFSRGRRYKEWPAKTCTFDKEWQERIKRERAI